MYIYCVNMDHDLNENLFIEMIKYISPEKQAKIHRFRKRIDALRSLIGDLIIRLILCKHYGFHNDEIKYAYQEFGKPYLPEHPDIHFNISHSGDWVVGIVSDSSVGIDIEKITEMKSDISSLVLAEDENKKLHKLHENERGPFFFELWTLKESYSKVTGKGLSEGLQELKISFNNGIISMEKNEKPIRAYFEILDCIEGYKFSLCSLSENSDKYVELIMLSELIKATIRYLDY